MIICNKCDSEIESMDHDNTLLVKNELRVYFKGKDLCEQCDIKLIKLIRDWINEKPLVK